MSDFSAGIRRGKLNFDMTWCLRLGFGRSGRARPGLLGILEIGFVAKLRTGRESHCCLNIFLVGPSLGPETHLEQELDSAGCWMCSGYSM